MEILTLKNKIHNTVEMLSDNQLIIALNLLEDLQYSDEDETQTLLTDPGFIKEYRQAKKDIHTGNTINWKDIKRDV